MNEKQKHELKLLAENLMRVPAELFTMNCWGEGDPSKADLESIECHYAGCAIGWAPMLIPGCGLTLKKGSYSSVFPYYEGEERLDAVCLYFGLTFREALYLFDLESYEDDGDSWEGECNITREAVSARILEFLQMKEDTPLTAPVDARS
jgi:hypothetical protein